MIDFNKIMAIDNLVKSNTVLIGVLKIDLKKEIILVGAFGTKADAKQCVMWLNEKMPLEQGVYMIVDVPLKKWKGNNA